MNAQATVQTQATKPTVTPVTHGLLQRCTATQECDECRKKREGLLQRAAVDSSPVGEVPPIVHEVLRSPGQPLDAQTRTFMEPRFGHDFSQVRVHTDGKATESARAVNALAYTVGNAIVMGAGQYVPGRISGRELLAHELTHVVQQRSLALVPGEQLRIDDDGSHAETQAQQMAGSLARGEPSVRTPAVILSPRVQRQPAGRGLGASVSPTIDTIVVDQAKQDVTITWSDGHTESDMCSTGKGHCCIDESAAEGAACSVAGSSAGGSNCTPVGTFRVTKKIPKTASGVELWTQFVDSRGIALHDYDPRVDGTPLSHGCVRLHRPMAQKIYDGSIHRGPIRDRTRVTVRNLAQPRCSHPALQWEWLHDFQTAGTVPPDGDRIDPVTGQRRTRDELRERARKRRSIARERRDLRSALGVEEAELDRVIDALQTPPGGLKDMTNFAAQEALLAQIPRCVPTLTREEAGVVANAAGSPTGQEARVRAFQRALQRIGSMRAARRVVRRAGRDLWDAATAESATGHAGADYRMIYSRQLQLASVLRSFEPSWMRPPAMNPDQARRAREELLSILERATRGMEGAEFSELVESHLAFLRSRPGGAGSAVRENVEKREFHRTASRWDLLDRARQDDWRRRASMAISAVTASVRGTELESIIAQSELVFNPEDVESFDPPVYAYNYAGSNRLFFGRHWVEDVERDPRSVWPNIAHELRGHELYGTTWSWEIAQAALARLSPEERVEAGAALTGRATQAVRSAYGYPETEIYAELRELRYGIARPGAQEATRNEVVDHLNRMVELFGPEVAGQIALRLYHRVLDDQDVTPEARRVLYDAIQRAFPRLIPNSSRIAP